MDYGSCSQSSSRKVESKQSSLLHLEALEERVVLSVGFQSEPVVPVINSLMKANLQSIYRLGQSLGNRPNVFMKAGDSSTYSGYYLNPLAALPSIDATLSTLGSFSALASTLGFFLTQPVDGSGTDSYSRVSIATYGGWTSTDLLVPGKRGANPGSIASPFASPLLAEIQELRPSVALVMIGTNDTYLTHDPNVYHANLNGIVQVLASQGVIPILSSIPPINLNGDPGLASLVLQFNQISADVADANQIPYLNLWAALTQIPFDGLGPDGVHLSISPNGPAALSGVDLAYGMNLRNLISVQALDKVLRIVMQNGPADLSTPSVSARQVVPFVDAIYQSILQREPDEGGRALFTEQLNLGVSTHEIVTQLWQSPEHRALQIDRYYLEFLQRPADEAGTQWWLQAFATGLTETAIKVGFVESVEYVHAHPNTTAFIAGLYRDVLQHEPTEFEMYLWETQVQNGLSLDMVARRILASPEALGVLVNQYYVEFLGRTADANARQAAQGLLQDPYVGDLRLGQALLSSAEYVESL